MRGDEFALLLPETDLNQALSAAERLREQLAAHPLVVESARVNILISVGVAGAALSMSGIGALINAADKAMYAAKSTGRNRVVAYQPRTREQQLAAE